MCLAMRRLLGGMRAGVRRDRADRRSRGQKDSEQQHAGSAQHRQGPAVSPWPGIVRDGRHLLASTHSSAGLEPEWTRWTFLHDGRPLLHARAEDNRTQLISRPSWHAPQSYRSRLRSRGDQTCRAPTYVSAPSPSPTSVQRARRIAARAKAHVLALGVGSGLRPYRSERWSPQRWERAYSSGEFEFMSDLYELPRYSLLVGYLRAYSGYPHRARHRLRNGLAATAPRRR